MEKIKNWISKTLPNIIKNNPKEFWVLLGILLLSAFLRLYKIDQYMTFLGDEGRDVVIVRRFLTELHPPLIGPGTSVGNMYLGPLYYYMMAPALLLANFSPVGPAVQIAILGVITVFFVWFIGREWFGKVGGLVGAGLYAISPTVIIFSRSSWNPNIMPFFALLSIYAAWKMWKDRNYKWLIVLGISFAFVLQSHYLGLILAPVLFVFWVLTFKDLKKKVADSQLFKNFLKKSVLGLLTFSLFMSPLLIFDIRHGWINLSAVESFFTSRKDIGLSFADYLSKAGSVAVMISSNLVSAKNIYLSIATLIIFTLIAIWLFMGEEFVERRLKSPLGFLCLWLFVGVVGISFYKGSVYDHYLGFLFPAPFLLLGGIAQHIFKLWEMGEKRTKFWSLVFGVYLLLLVGINLKNSPILSSPNMQMPRAISVARVVQEKAGGERFNLATISHINNREVYKYFLMIWGAKVVDTDPSSSSFTITDQLFVVCELPRDECDPTHNPSAWITSFGWTRIVDEWEVWGGTLFKLGHTK